MYRKISSTVILLLLMNLIVMDLHGAERRRRRDTEAESGSADMVSEEKKDAEREKDLEAKKESMKTRNDAIRQLKQLISEYPEGPRKAELYRRLAELYWEQARAIKDVIMAEYNKATDRYYEIGDDTAPAPELNLEPAWKWNRDAVKVCEHILKQYPDFEGMDEVYYFMASNLMEVGKPLRAIRQYNLIIERYPNSKFASDAYFRMGEYFFDNNNVFKAMPNYKAILEKYPQNQFYPLALYKYAWCLYNVGEYQQSIDYFKKTVEFSKKNERVSLTENALKDMVAPYAEAGDYKDAEQYFKNVVEDKRYYVMVLIRLAAIYFEQDRTDEAIKIYGILLREAPENHNAYLWQTKIIEAYKKKNDKENVRKEIFTLVAKYADKNSKWSKANKEDTAALESARQSAENALRKLTVEYHNEARKTDAEETWEILGEVYPIYLKYFPDSEASYDIRFNYAEYLYDNAGRYRKRGNQKKARELFEKAGDQYQIVAEEDPRGHHFEDASFGSVSCFGAILQAEHEKAKDRAKQRLAKRREEETEIDSEKVVVAEEGEKDKEKKKEKKEIPDEFKKREIPEIHTKYIAATKTYIENIPKSKYLPNIIYQQAITYYSFNHFDKAVPIFEKLIERYPRHELSLFAADLIMTSLDISGDWEAISKKAREFLRNSALISGRNRLRDDLEKFKEMGTFYAAEIPKENGKYIESAERYLAFVTEFPRSQYNDVALYNAIVYFQEGGDRYQAIRIQERFLRETDKIYKNSQHRDKVMYGLARNYEAIAYYGKAADLYMDFIEKSPDGEQAGDALFNAAVLYEYTGDTSKSIDNYKLYIDKYEKDEDSQRKIALQFGYIWRRKGKTYNDRAKKGFRNYLSTYTDIMGLRDYVYIGENGHLQEDVVEQDVEVEKGDQNMIIAVYNELADMAEEENKEKDRYRYLDYILQLSRTGKFKEEKEVVQQTRDIIAKAMIVELDDVYTEFMDIDLDIDFKEKMKGYKFIEMGYGMDDESVVDVNGNNVDDQVMPSEKRQLKVAWKEKEKFDEEIQERLTKKVEIMVDNEEKYMKIIETTQSPRYTPAVLYYIGKMYRDITEKMFDAPVPPWLNDAQIAAYKQMLDERALNAREKAVEILKAAINQGFNTSVYNKWLKKAKRELAYFKEVTHGEFYIENEIVPEPDSVEISSQIGRVDTDFLFPELSDKERKDLKKMLNKTGSVKPAKTEVVSEKEKVSDKKEISE